MSSEQVIVLSPETRALFILGEGAKDSPSYSLSSQGQLSRLASTASNDTSLVLEFSESSFPPSENNLFALGDCHIQVSSCKTYLALYFLDADLAWMVDRRQQKLFQFDWTNQKFRTIYPFSISFRDSPSVQVAVVSCIPEKDASVTISKALFLGLCGQGAAAMTMVTNRFPEGTDERAAACELIVECTSDFETGKKALDEALKIYKITKKEQSEEVATVMLSLGKLYHDQGRYKEAMDEFFAALDMRQNFYGNDSLLVAEVFYYMGCTLYLQHSLDQAMDCFEEAKQIQKSLSNDSVQLGDTLHKMGLVQAENDELDKATTILFEAYQLFKSVGDLLKASDSLYSLGDAHRVKKEYELALECFEESMSIRKLLLGDQHEKAAEALIGIGNLKFDQDEKEEAKKKYEEALSMLQSCLHENDNKIADIIFKIAGIEFASGDNDRALQLYTRGVEIRDANNVKDKELVNALFAMGNIQNKRGNSEEAYKLWRRGYEMFQELDLLKESPEMAEAVEIVRKLLGEPDPRGFLERAREGLQGITAKLPSRKDGA